MFFQIAHRGPGSKGQVKDMKFFNNSFFSNCFNKDMVRALSVVKKVLWICAIMCISILTETTSNSMLEKRPILPPYVHNLQPFRTDKLTILHSSSMHAFSS